MTLTEILAMDRSFDLFDEPHGPDPHLIAAGLIPPLPYAASDRPVLIWGWSIVRAATAQERMELPVRLLETDRTESLRIAIRMEGRPGRLSLREQVRIAGLARAANIPLSDELSELVRGDRGLAGIVERIGALPEHIAAAVTDGAVDLKVGERIRNLPAGPFTACAAEVRALSHSSRRQFLEMLAEVAARDSLSEAEVTQLAARACASANTGADSGDGDGVPAGRRLADPVACLRRSRYPMLTAMEEQLASVVEREFSGTGVTVSAPPYFEGDSYTVQFAFRSCAEVDRRLAAAGRLKDCCEELLGLL